MNPDKKSSKQEEKERINLNDYNRKDEDSASAEHSDQSIKDVARNLNEQIGGTDDTVTGEPNHV
jgi:hypothetical protein